MVRNLFHNGIWDNEELKPKKAYRESSDSIELLGINTRKDLSKEALTNHNQWVGKSILENKFSTSDLLEHETDFSTISGVKCGANLSIKSSI